MLMLATTTHYNLTLLKDDDDDDDDRGDVVADVVSGRALVGSVFF